MLCNCPLSAPTAPILQGTIEGLSSYADVDLGTLDIKGTSATFVIGSHRLDGTVVSVKKPIAVVRRHARLDAAHAASGEGAGDAPLAAASSSGVHSDFDLVGVVRRKVYFKTRPQPIIDYQPTEPLQKKRRLAMEAAVADTAADASAPAMSS